MENEENRRLFDKNAYEDQLVPFIILVSELSLYSLCHTLGQLEFSWCISTLDQERKRRKRGRKYQARKSRIKQLQRDSLQVSIFMCGFLAIFGMHNVACVFLVLLLSWAWIFPSVKMFFSLALAFLDSHGFMGFSCCG